MASINETVFPPSPMLAHSLNTRGELGMYVNPYGCSCITCRNYIADRAAEKAVKQHPASLPPPTPISLTTLPPALSESTAAGILASMGLGMGTLPVNLGPTALTRSDTGYHYVEEDDTGLGPSISVNPYLDIWGPGTGAGGRLATTQESRGEVTLTAEQAAIVKESLEEHMKTLADQQTALEDHSGCRSHDEMAAQDMEWEMLDRKIAEIDDILAVLRAAEEE